MLRMEAPFATFVIRPTLQNGFLISNKSPDKVERMQPNGYSQHHQFEGVTDRTSG